MSAQSAQPIAPCAKGQQLEDVIDCRDVRLDAAARLLGLIQAILSEDEAEGLEALNVTLVHAADGRVILRRALVAPLIRAKRLNAAAAVLTVLTAAYPSNIDDRRTLASVLARMGRWGAAIENADHAAELAPDDLSLQRARIQIRLLAGAVTAAADIARTLGDRVQEDNQLGHLAMTALVRDGDVEGSVRVALASDTAALANERLSSTVVRALLAGGLVPQAVAAGEAALGAGRDGAALRLQLAQAYLAGGPFRQRHALAADHLAAGLAFAPEDVRLNSLYGAVLLRTGRFTDAVPYLDKVCQGIPAHEQTRALHARALKHSGRHAEAADTYLHLMHAAPNQVRWERHAAAALNQAGRKTEAQDIFAASVARRRQALPPTLEAGLAALWDKLETATLPTARLDWAWALQGGVPPEDRAAWERAARWGHLADHLLLDWLECCDDRAEEAMVLLADLDEMENSISALRAGNRGIVFASAHIGPMYAGPMVLELLGLRSCWLASTPSVARSSYARSLISTSDQTEAQVVKATLRALQDGSVVALAVDGAANPAAPRIAFEGREITYSSFAARSVYRTGAWSIFCAPQWRDGRIHVVFECLPAPEPEETLELFAGRWRTAYLGHLRQALAGSPENLRLSGGLWRHIS